MSEVSMIRQAKSSLPHTPDILFEKHQLSYLGAVANSKHLLNKTLLSLWPNILLLGWVSSVYQTNHVGKTQQTSFLKLKW